MGVLKESSSTIKLQEFNWIIFYLQILNNICDILLHVHAHNVVFSCDILYVKCIVRYWSTLMIVPNSLYYGMINHYQLNIVIYGLSLIAHSILPYASFINSPKIKEWITSCNICTYSVHMYLRHTPMLMASFPGLILWRKVLNYTPAHRVA